MGSAVRRVPSLSLALLAIGLTLPLAAEATPLGMDPGAVWLPWNTSYIPTHSDGEGDVWITFLAGETDGATTVLTLEFAVRLYHYEPGGRFTFDVPIISAISPSVVLVFGPLFGDNSISWGYTYGCCFNYPGYTNTLTLTFELAGVPNVGEFTVLTESASVAFSPIPEPDTGMLVIAGLLGLAAQRRVRA